MARSDQFTVGIDFGTLSGRAVVVRVSDGAEVGSAVHDYAHGVLDTRLAAGAVTAPAGLGAAGAERLPSTCSPTPYPRRCASPGSTRPGASASRPTSPPARCCRCWRTGRRCASCPSTPTGRTPTSSSGSTTPPRPRPIGSTSSRTRGGESWIGRYGGLISSEWEFAKGLQLLEEDPELYARDGPLRRGGGLDRLAAHAAATSATRAPPATRASTRTARYPDRDFLAALNPGFAGFAEDKLAARDRPARRRGGAAHREAAALTGLPVGIAVAVGNVDAHVTAPAARATEPGQMVAIMGTSTCHVMSHDAPGRGAGHVRGRRRRHRGRQLGLRSRPERGRGHLRLVHAHLGARGVRRGGGRGR